MFLSTSPCQQVNLPAVAVARSLAVPTACASPVCFRRSTTGEVFPEGRFTGVCLGGPKWTLVHDATVGLWICVGLCGPFLNHGSCRFSSSENTLTAARSVQRFGLSCATRDSYKTQNSYPCVFASHKPKLSAESQWLYIYIICMICIYTVYIYILLCNCIMSELKLASLAVISEGEQTQKNRTMEDKEQKEAG